ncbi:unnamed protein product, partial [Gongylonema pulchrum]|uniref:TPX2 domain-containing protein n=1 Tax=Gongylonema pulchrum TaxID=637853 RepID=A0A183DK56_9BILA
MVKKSDAFARKQELEDWQKIGTPPLATINAAPVPKDVPRLEDLTSDRSSRNHGSEKRQRITKAEKRLRSASCTESSSSSTSSASMDRVWSISTVSSAASEAVTSHRTKKREETSHKNK